MGGSQWEVNEVNGPKSMGTVLIDFCCYRNHKNYPLLCMVIFRYCFEKLGSIGMMRWGWFSWHRKSSGKVSENET